MIKLSQDKNLKDLIGGNQVLMQINLFLMRYFNLLMIGVLLLIFIIGVLFVVYPKYKVSSVEVDNIRSKKEAQFNKLKLYHHQLSSILADYNKISKFDKDKLNKLLPTGDNIDYLFVDMEKTIKGRGLILKSLQITPKSGAKKDSPISSRRKTKIKKRKSIMDNVGEIEINIQLSGITYPELKKLLKVLESKLPLMDVKSLQVSLDNSSLSMVISTYYLKQS